MPDTLPKYQSVYAALRRDIEAGRWKAGDRLPTEADLVRTFGASRITVGRAVRELQSAGLVQRRAGSGTYVAAPKSSPRGLSFGLLIPDLGETEIFEPICKGMMSSPIAREHALLWGSMDGANASAADRAWQLCRQYLERRVAGVFFAPLEPAADHGDVNRRIVRALEAASIPLVLLDRPISRERRAPDHDFVGIDNRQAGLTMTDHLLRRGCRRLAFVGLAGAAATVDAREAGYREALFAAGSSMNLPSIRRLDPSDTSAVRSLMDTNEPDAIVCANDRTAGLLMHTLLQLGYRIPDDVRLVGIDDIEYAKLLPVPLTTLRQPTRHIGDAALSAMLERVRRPELHPRDILLHCELVIRDSCGTNSVMNP